MTDYCDVYGWFFFLGDHKFLYLKWLLVSLFAFFIRFLKLENILLLVILDRS